MTLAERLTDWTADNIIIHHKRPMPDEFDSTFMTYVEKADILRRAMDNARGDDLERAELSFRHLTENQLDEEFGQSRRTKRDVRDEYRERRARWEAAYEFLNQLLRAKGL